MKVQAYGFPSVGGGIILIYFRDQTHLGPLNNSFPVRLFNYKITVGNFMMHRKFGKFRFKV